MASTTGLDYKDYYAVLGVPKTATSADIKKAFRKLARQHHPDAKPGDTEAERRFKEVNEANEVLSDPAKRKQYDELGANWDAISRARQEGAAGGAGNPFGGFGTGFGGGGNVRYEFHTSDDPGEFSDFFRVFFGADMTEPPGAGRATGRGSQARPAMGFEDIVSGMGIDGRTTGTAGSMRPPPSTPPTHEARAEITLAEAYHGTTRLVEVEGKRLEIKIPPGADTGTRIKLTKRGPGGGDLIVVVRVLPDARFTRRGADLERELLLTLEEALLGAEVKVETLKGGVLLKIPAGTQPGRTFRLSGQGMPRFKASGHGDLYVKARVILPTNLSDEAKAAARPFFDLVKPTDPADS
jgi:curved DNA-binding protein